MKLSLAWIFDHIVNSSGISVETLVEKFNKTTAEISSYQHIKSNVDTLFLVKTAQIDKEKVRVFCPETQDYYVLTGRADIKPDAWYLIVRDKEISWASMKDLGSDKESLLPAIYCPDEQQQGGWRKLVEAQDVTLVIDNKSITHRPDLWSHRGIAREVAAIFDKQLVPENSLLLNMPLVHFEQNSAAGPDMPYALDNQVPTLCKRFAVCYIDNIHHKPSTLSYAFRLARIDAKPINALVDATNYTMFDIGQPLHAFDAQELKTKKIVIKKAHKQPLLLLDGTTVELMPDDIVISDGKQQLSLAGIMGGAASAVNENTQSVVLEAANFQASVIRKSSLHHKKRTESSVRFEKSLDPLLNIVGLQRCLFLLRASGVLIKLPSHIVSLGKSDSAQMIDVPHELIEKKLGASVSDEFVITTLQRLSFSVKKYMHHQKMVYQIIVPTFRSSRDLFHEADIVEEIARFYGFDTIEKILPFFSKKAQSITPVIHERVLKNIIAFGWQAHEVSNYALYDEQFLQQLSWKPQHTLQVINPVSSYSYQLVTSLIPHLLKNIMINSSEYATMRLFEWNRIWSHKDGIAEKHMIAGISYAKKDQIDFYKEKNDLTCVFDALHLKKIRWEKATDMHEPWWDIYQTADIYYQDHYIGRAGKIDRLFLTRCVEGQAFIFQCDVQKLLQLSYEQENKFIPLPKFPHTSFDVSMLMRDEITLDHIKKQLKQADERIIEVDLVDYFRKEEWIDKKAITVRCIARDKHKTLTKDDIDALYKKVLSVLQSLGVEIR